MLKSQADEVSGSAFASDGRNGLGLTFLGLPPGPLCARAHQAAPSACNPRHREGSLHRAPAPHRGSTPALRPAGAGHLQGTLPHCGPNSAPPPGEGTWWAQRLQFSCKCPCYDTCCVGNLWTHHFKVPDVPFPCGKKTRKDFQNSLLTTLLRKSHLSKPQSSYQLLSI